MRWACDCALAPVWYFSVMRRPILALATPRIFEWTGAAPSAISAQKDAPRLNASVNGSNCAVWNPALSNPVPGAAARTPPTWRLAVTGSWPALNSFFGEYRTRDAQTAQLRAALEGMPAGEFEVWVTHQVNMTALTGEGMAMGEALVLDVTGTVLARSTFV